MKLNLKESYTRDVGRGVCRIDYDDMDTLKLSTGDFVKLTGKKITLAKCLPLYPSDERLKMIRTDKMIRDNAGIQIGGKITIEKMTKPKGAILIMAKLPKTALPLDPRYLTDALEAVGMIKGDKFLVPYFGGKIEVVIKKTMPKGFVQVVHTTSFVINSTKIRICPTCGSKL